MGSFESKDKYRETKNTAKHRDGDAAVQPPDKGLSKMASSKLTDNNPNAADLNDLNRPTRIAERFSELFNNGWTDAFDDLKEKHEKTDMQSINMLLEIELKIHEKCQTRAASDLKQLKNTIEKFINVEQLPDSMSSSLKVYKDERKKNFKTFLPSFEQEMEQTSEHITGLKYDQVPNVKTYVELSTELCWLMAIQDPPVVMLTKCEARDIFNGNVYKSYTCNGKLVEYLVWPALYLHEDGPLLAEGVAQCLKDNLGTEDINTGDDNSQQSEKGHSDSDSLDGLSADSDSKQQQSADFIKSTDKCQDVDNEDNLPDQTPADSPGEVSSEHTNADVDLESTKMLKQKETSQEEYIKMLEEEKAKNVKLETRTAKGLKMLQDSYGERDQLREQLQSARQFQEKIVDVDAKLKESFAANERLHQQLQEKDQSIRQLYDKLKQQETSKEGYIKVFEEEKAKIVKLETRLKQKETSNEDYIKMLEEEKAKNVKLETRIEKSQNMLQDSYNERDKLREQYQHDIHNRERQLLSLQGELTKVKDEKDRLLIRLNAIAGVERTDSNPNITDLSDANRPTKLAEKYSELYDNAWTDAFSQLTEKDMKSEKEAIQILLDTFLNIYKECMTRADTQLEALTKAVTSFGTVEGDLSEIMKPLKDRRKKQYAIQVKQLEPLIVDQLLKTTSLATTDPNQIKPFLEKSLELCWLMAIQDPPVYADSDINIKGHAFDKNMFKEYTVSGKTIDFIVWPALFIQERGSLLCKGVAQGQKIKDIRADRAQTVRPVSSNAAMPAKTSNIGLSISVYGNSSSTATSLKQPPTQQVLSVARKAEQASSVTPSEPPPTDVIQKVNTLLSKGVAQRQKKKKVRADGAQTVKAVWSNAAKPAKTSNTALSKSAYGSSSSTAAQLKQPITQQMDSDGTYSASAPSVTPAKTPYTNVTSSEQQSTHQRNSVATKDARRSDATSIGSIKPPNSTAQPGQHKSSITVVHF